MLDIAFFLSFFMQQHTVSPVHKPETVSVRALVVDDPTIAPITDTEDEEADDDMVSCFTCGCGF